MRLPLRTFREHAGAVHCTAGRTSVFPQNPVRGLETRQAQRNCPEELP